MTSIFRLTVNSGQTVPIEFKEYMMVTISKGILMVRPDQTRPVLVTIKYQDLQDHKEKSEKLCVFDPGQTDVVIENLYYDTQRPTISVPEGATVRFEGVFTSCEEFADHDEEENSSSEAQDDEEDEDFQAEESE